MKKNSFRILVATLLFSSISCSKSNSNPAVANPILGSWAGSYQLDINPGLGSFYYRFDIVSDSIVFVSGNGTNGTSWYATGKWTLKGTAFGATVTTLDGLDDNVQSLTAVYDGVSGTLNTGIWKDIAGSNSGTGTFSLSRVQ
jgi:hypothetical protein